MSSETKMVTLKSSDNETFEVEEEVAIKSQTIKHLIEDDCANTTIPLANVTGKILAKVIEYCKKHVESTKVDEANKKNDEDDLKSHDADLIDNADQRTLFDLILAANYLNIRSLLDLACQKVADTIKNKKVEEIREYFSIENDFTPEEEEEVREENAWATAATMSSETKMITLKSSDNETFEVEEAVAIESQTIKHMIEDDCANTTIPLPNVTGRILAKVIEYCKKHVESPKADDEANKNADEDDLKSFDTNFLDVDQPTLFDLILAANYLNIKSLLDLTCRKTADMIRDYSADQVRKTFNIENDFTPEEEEAVRNENAWAFEN